MAKTIARIRAFFQERPGMNRSQFAKRADLHRNSFYGMDASDWNPRVETIEKLLQAIEKYEAEEAKAQRKTRPSKLPELALAS